jgi:integrase
MVSVKYFHKFLLGGYYIMLYEDVVEKWLEEKSYAVRTSSIKNYYYAAKKTITPVFGSMECSAIIQKDIQNFIYQTSKNYRRCTIQNMTKVLSQSFQWAVKNGIITSSPFVDIIIPKDRELREICVFTEEEIHLLLNSDNGHKRDMILLSYHTGMRVGEVLALKWSDIDFTHGFLTIRRTLSGYYHGKAEFAEPKTKKSIRRIELDIVTLNMLTFRKNKAFGDFVFCKRDGSPYSRQCIRLNKLCLGVGIAPRGFHTLRHTHASVLLAHEVHPKIVQERLGHSNIAMTLDTYSHLIPSMQKAAVDVFNQIGAQSNK